LAKSLISDYRAKNRANKGKVIAVKPTSSQNAAFIPLVKAIGMLEKKTRTAKKTSPARRFVVREALA
jgi:hypothetical protein